LPPVKTVDEDEERVLRLLEECPAGGLLLFNGGPDTKQALERLQAASKIPLLVGSDVERGVGQQVKGYTLFPHLMAFGKLPEEESYAAVERIAKSIAHEARDVGLHIAFAPVADVNTNPNNPIISTRAFGEDADRVAQLVAYFVAELQTYDIIATAKHFPGHGDTYKDSHAELPTVERSPEELENCDLMPFRAAISAGCEMIMTAHVAYPAIDPSGVPATLSPIILQRLLRQKMRFRGVVCSDSLLMAGVRDRFESEGELALATLAAGVDLLLDLEDPAAVVDYLVECVEQGMISETRIDESLERLRPLKGVATRQKTNWAEYGRTSAEQVARDTIHVIDTAGRRALHLKSYLPLVAILLKPFETSLEPPEQPLGAALRERFRNVRYVQLGPKADQAVYRDAAIIARDAKQLVVAIIVRPAAWHAYGLLPEQVTLVQRILSERDDVVLVSLGAPYPLDDYPMAAMRICTYSDVPVSQQALAEFLVSE
jgi:beta-glucosidase-like glycosyl hydrolase